MSAAEEYFGRHFWIDGAVRHDGLSDALAGQTALANSTVSLLHKLQDAHEMIVKRDAVKLLMEIIKGLGDGKVTPAQVKEVFEAGPEAMEELTKWLETAKPTVSPETM
jgi:hypothetical protein